MCIDNIVCVCVIRIANSMHIMPRKENEIILHIYWAVGVLVLNDFDLML